MYRQATLFSEAPIAVDDGFARLERIELDETAWVDHAPHWLSGADDVFDWLVANLEWQHQDVWMYGRLLPEPRLSASWTPADGAEPLPVLAGMRTMLSQRYGATFSTIGFNRYRHGDDSVAWHADTKGPPIVDPTIAIVSVGARRPFRLRPKGGGRSVRFDLGDGDLLVMGGSCQHTWEHTVPKARGAGPRISITYRHGGNH